MKNVIRMTQDIDKWKTLINTVMNFWVSTDAGILFSF
jgi:hypothetical protein